MTKTALSSAPISGIDAYMIEGTPWFELKSTARAIGLTPSRLPTLLDRLDADQVHRSGSLTYINESAVYFLCFRGRSKAARTMQDWICQEVLPAVRKHGGYLLNEHGRKLAGQADRSEVPYPVEAEAAFLSIAEQELQTLRAIAEKQRLFIEKLLKSRPDLGLSDLDAE